MSVLQRLTEGVQSRDLRAEGAALLDKWEATGLLEGLDNENQRQGMAVLLENQAKELLREASSMAAGDVEGFAAVAFPIVRRVFGGLIANDLISVQPMSLPSGLIFFLDFTHSSDRFGQQGQSLYGGGVVGRGIVDGVDDIEETGFYGLTSGYAAATGSISVANAGVTAAEITAAAAPNNTALDYDPDVGSHPVITLDLAAGAFTDDAARGLIDPGQVRAIAIAEQADAAATGAVNVASADFARIARDPVNGDLLLCARENGGGTCLGLTVGNDDVVVARLKPLRRLSKATVQTNASGLKEVATISRLAFELVSVADLAGQASLENLTGAEIRALEQALAVGGGDVDDRRNTPSANSITSVATVLASSDFALQVPLRDNLVASQNALGGIAGAAPWGLEEPTPAGVDAGGAKASGGGTTQAIAEIDIKVDSVAVTAQTKKLKAKWSPELGQDLNAYHNLDAEVELTGILSEQIALEIDREILGELVDGAKAGTRYWSRAPGLFVNSAGTEIGANSAAPDFTGTVSEWYETLIETINDVSAQIHRKTLRGGANFVVCSPEVANILEFTSGFRASVTADQDRGTIGAVKAGSLSKKFDVYVDPYFLRNVLLVGRKGSSFLESGFVYAPYVPLQVTPTIFGTEDFVPRKGVMTRYAKKMVRPDMYGLVIVRGLLGESGGP